VLLDETRPLTVLEGAEMRRRWEAARRPVGILRFEQKLTEAELGEVKARWQEKVKGGQLRVIHGAGPGREFSPASDEASATTTRPWWSRVLRWFA
jgi:hypothetical protein